MQKVRYFAKGVWVDRHLAQWITTIMIMVHMGLATSIVVGGVERFSIPSYSPLIDYVQGETWLWGMAIGLSGMLMSVPFRWPQIIGLWIGMVWHIIWMACFVIAVIHYPTAAATAIPAYGGFALICSALLTARVIDKTGE
jgi:hypothetical protein